MAAKTVQPLFLVLPLLLLAIYFSVRRGLKPLDDLTAGVSDGSVEVVACGDAHAIEVLAQWLEEGPPQARVDEVVREPDFFESYTK